MNNDDTKKLIEAMKEVFPTAEMVQREFTAIHNEMKNGFEHIEKILLTAQEKRIEKLEKQMERVLDALAMK